MNRRVLVALLVSGSLAGCGGGGASRALSPVPGTPATGSPSTGSSSARGRATVRLTIPRRSSTSGRHRNFVSPSTDGVSVEVTHQTNNVVDYDVTVNFDVSPGSTSSCTGSDPQICTLQIPAPIAPSPDSDTFAFTLYDQAPTGTPLAFGPGAHVLGSGTVVTAIAPNVNNTLAAYIGGTPASVAFAEPVISGDGYLGFSSNFGVEALDAQQNVIIGGVYDPYNPGFALAVTDQNTPAGSTTLGIAVSDLSSYSPAPPSCNAAASAQTSITTCRSSDVLSFAYLQPSTSTFNPSYYATVAASSQSLSSGALYVSPIYVLDTTDTASPTDGGASFTQGSSGTSPLLALDGGTGTVTLSEPGPTAEGAPLSFTESDNGNCSNVIASGGVTATSATTFTIAAPATTAAVSNATHRVARIAQQRSQRNAKRRTLDNTACALTFTDNYGGKVVLDVTDAGESAQFVGIPGETLYAGYGGAPSSNEYANFDQVNVQPGSPYFGDPYFQGGGVFNFLEATQAAHTVPDQNGNYTIVFADDKNSWIGLEGFSSPNASNSSYQLISGGAQKFVSITGGVALDSAGHAYVSQASAIDIYTTNGQFPSQFASVALPGSSPNATGIALDSGGRVYVADSSGNLVDVYANDLSGGLTLLEQIPTGAGSDPKGVALDPAGDLFVVLANDNTASPTASQVVVFPPGATTPAASATVTPAGFGVAADGKGQVFVETAGAAPANGGPAGGGIYQYAFTAATQAAAATLTSVGALTYNSAPTQFAFGGPMTGGYLNF